MRIPKLKVTTILLFLIIWEIIAGANIFSPHIFPSISGSILWGINNYEQLSNSAWTTLRLLLLSLIFSVLISLFLGGLSSISKKFRTIIESFLSMVSPLPSVSLLPFALLWFGLGDNPIIFVTSFGAITVFTSHIIDGFTTINKILIDIGRNYGLHGWKMIRHILIPSALPSIITGFRSAWAVSWRTVVASELVFGAVGLKGGLGWVIYCQRFHLNPNGMMSALMCISLIGIIMEHVVLETIENRTVKKWGMKID